MAHGHERIVARLDGPLDSGRHDEDDRGYDDIVKVLVDLLGAGHDAQEIVGEEGGERDDEHAERLPATPRDEPSYDQREALEGRQQVHLVGGLVGLQERYGGEEKRDEGR